MFNFFWRRNIFLALFLFIFLFFGVNVVLADIGTVLPDTSTLDPKSCECKNSPTDEPCKKYCGSYQLNDFMRLVARGAEMILGIVGSLALLAFVVGGFMFVFSAGDKEWVSKGMASMKGAVIGLLIVFLSYTIIYFVFKSLGITGDIFTTGKFTEWKKN